MNATDYWPLARGYSVWDATVATYSFGQLILNLNSSVAPLNESTLLLLYYLHALLCNQPEVLFDNFVTTLNATFERTLSRRCRIWEWQQKFQYIHSLRWTSRDHHVSSNENISFNPSTPHTTVTSQLNHKPVCHWLSFSSDDNKDSSAVHSPSHNSHPLPQNPMGFAQQPLTKFIYTYVMTSKKKKKKISNQLHWTMTIGSQTQFQIGICVSMTSHSNISMFLPLSI